VDLPSGIDRQRVADMTMKRIDAVPGVLVTRLQVDVFHPLLKLPPPADLGTEKRVALGDQQLAEVIVYAKRSTRLDRVVEKVPAELLVVRNPIGLFRPGRARGCAHRESQVCHWAVS